MSTFRGSSVISLPIRYDGDFGTSLEATLTVAYSYEPAQRGGRDRWGFDPDSDECIDIEEAVLMVGEHIVSRNPDYDEAQVIAAIKADARARDDDARIDAYLAREAA